MVEHSQSSSIACQLCIPFVPSNCYLLSDRVFKLVGTSRSLTTPLFNWKLRIERVHSSGYAMSRNKLRTGAFMVGSGKLWHASKIKSYLFGFYPAEIEIEMAGAFSIQTM
ncbi:adenylyl-sulfate kinase 3 [Gossypium australe]|uniref:Adenylyl-sulfate kinase 3 n=1 Tax=Gossypium australe TaxID=47621 RepID=A0A5B6VTF9_9ROSI|nr:adenylyl-sulfate kinase 3 [Gossypium australe]